MKRLSLIILLLFPSFFISAQGVVRSAVDNAIPGDNVLRFYRLAIPVTNNAFEEDFGSDYDEVVAFWRECEEFVNKVFVPVGFCFDVIEDSRLLVSSRYDDYGVFELDTDLLNSVIGSDEYDIGMWVTHRPEESENTGQSAACGAYSQYAKGTGYAKPDCWVVAHEIGHLLGADHTMPGEGSLMDNAGEFLSYPSIVKIREACMSQNAAYYSDAQRTRLVGNNAGGNYVYGVKVSANAPCFVQDKMRNVYRIPQGSCLSIELFAEDADDDRLKFMSTGDDVEMIASLPPQEGNIIEYRPKYSADIFYPEYFYPVMGTDIPMLEPGSYGLKLLVYDHPADCSLETMMGAPFYCNYAVWNAAVEVLPGSGFAVSLSPRKECYTAGESVAVEWNGDCFSADSRLRVTMSADYGATFAYLLAESVPARDGSCTVNIPDVNIGNVDVDFITAVRSMPGGIIRVEEIGGAAFMLTAVSPDMGGSFNVTGAAGTSIGKVVTDGFSGEVYDLQGRRVTTGTASLAPGVYVRDGKKYLVNEW